MAPTKAAVDLNAMIQAGENYAESSAHKIADSSPDRQRRKNAALAQEIFGKNRRQSAPGAGVAKAKSGAVPSLASRIGAAGITKVRVAKRFDSAAI